LVRYPADPGTLTSTELWNVALQQFFRANQTCIAFPTARVATVQNSAIRTENELAREVEFGADIRFFQDRIGLDAAVYKRTLSTKSSDWLRTRRVYNSRYITPAISERGVELLLTAIPSDEEFQLDDEYQLYPNVNKIVALAPGAQSDELRWLLGRMRRLCRRRQQYGQLSPVTVRQI